MTDWSLASPIPLRLAFLLYNRGFIAQGIEAIAVVLLTFSKRKAGLPHEEFTSHWRDIYGPLVREMPNFKR